MAQAAETDNLITVATSTHGVLCKSFPGEGGGVFSKGYAETVKCHSLTNLREILKGVNENQCLIMGYPKDTKVGDVTSINTKDKCQAGEIARAKDNFKPSSYILIDYDYTKKFKCRRASDVHEYLCQLLPEVFQGAGYLSRKSSSSRVLKAGQHIKNTSWHLYYQVDDPFKSKWLADNLLRSATDQDLIYYKQSTDEKSLLRTVIDLQPLKIGACGISYEADPIVSGDYTLTDSKIILHEGEIAKSSHLKPVPKGKRKEPKPAPKKQDKHLYGFIQMQRRLFYSPAYKALSVQAESILNTILMQWKGGDHGTEKNPIKCPHTEFKVTRDVREHLDKLQEIGFIWYKSGRKQRVENLYYLNFDMLFLKAPPGWKPW